MAEGGVPDVNDFAQWQENFQAQNEEIAVLQCIFEGEEEWLHILDSADHDLCKHRGDNIRHQDIKMYIQVKVADKMHVDVYLPIETRRDTDVHADIKQAHHFTRSESGQKMIFNFEVSYLPPVCVHVIFPETYPSNDPPYYLLSCVWLSPQQLTEVCKQFDKLWQDNKGDTDSPGMPILYTWLDWLQECLLKTLGIESHLSVTSHTLDEDTDDCRVVIETEDLNTIVTDMMRYNRQEEVKMFRKSRHECDICFEQNFGYNFYLLSECGHHICKECLCSHCKLLVKEGTVLQIRCPMCKAFIPPSILKEVLSQEDYTRFESLSLTKSLETMEDVKWCPRCNNPVIVEPDQDLNLAQCVVCFFTFCTACMEKWHQGEMCKTDEELCEQVTERNKEERSDEYERQKLEQYIQNKHSQLYIRKMAKRCPKCRSPIMKTGGCNKVVCSYCHTAMCYVCEEQIDGYSHFMDSPRCSTFSFMEDIIDNTDMKNPVQQGFIQVNEAPRRRLAASTGKMVNDRLRDNPELRERSFRCSSCKQLNIKDTPSNHIHCWNCKVSICFHCKQNIKGTVGKHFSGISSCPQHTAI